MDGCQASIYLYDVPEAGGPLTLVAGSHRLPKAPQQTLDGKSTTCTCDLLTAAFHHRVRAQAPVWFVYP